MTKTKWHTKAMYLLVALAMVFSLAVVPGVVPKAQAFPDTTLSVTVTTDKPGYCYSDNVTVNVTVQNTGAVETAGSVNASIAYPPELGYVSGPTPPVFPIDLSPGAIITTQWVLHCEGPGVATINVTAWAVNAPPVTGTSDNITQWKSHLVVGLSVDETEVCPCENFTATVTVNNTGSGAAVNVTPILAKAGPATLTGPPPGMAPVIEPETEATFNWTFHCDGLGPVTLNVTGVNSTERCSGRPTTNIDLPPEKTVMQEGPDLEVAIDAPSRKCPCETFNVTATITNNSANCTAYCVQATIGVDANATVNTTATPITQNVTPPTLPPGQSGNVTWQLHCDNPGAVNITVDTVGYALSDCTVPVIGSNSTTMEQESPVLEVPSITAPVAACPCDTFNVTATVENTGNCTAYCVNATMNITGNASTMEPLTKPVGELDGGTSQNVTWAVHCDSEGDAVFNVTPTGYVFGNCTWPAPATSNQTTVMQLGAVPNLEPEITRPADSTWFGISDTFAVKALIHNTGCDDAGDVWAHIEIDGKASLIAGESAGKPLGPIAPGADSEHVSWTLHCDGPGDVTILVVATGKDPDGSPIQPQRLWTDEITVHQQPLTVVVLDPGDFCACDTFNVTAKITNHSSNSTAGNVTATIKVGANAELTDGATNDVGVIAGNTTVSTNWTLHCKGYGEVDISVDIKGMIDSKIFTSKSNTVTLKQKVLIVTIDEPKEGDFFSTSQNFWVNVYVENCSNSTATDVNAMIDPGLTASLVDRESWYKPLGDIPAGETQEVTWTLHCEKWGDSTIKVWVDGNWFDPVTGTTIDVGDEQSVTVHQRDKAHLVINVAPNYPTRHDYVWPCTNFTVTASIHNTGAVKAMNVTPFMTIDPSSSVTVLSGPTPPMQDINPYGWGYFDWELHCDNATWDLEHPNGYPTTFNVTAKGWDANTGQQILKENIEDGSTDILQKPFRVEITAPPNDAYFKPCNEWSVNATFYNYYDKDITGASATINNTGPAEIQTPPPLTQALPDIPSMGSVTIPIPWHMHCFALGDVDITVNATGWVEGVGMVENHDTITVHQTEEPPGPDLWVEITGPDPEFCPCQTFNVTYIVKNEGLTTANNVTVTIDPGAHAEVDALGEGVPWTSGSLGNLSPGQTTTLLSTELHCTGLGNTTVTITPGTITPDATVHSDSLVVEQDAFVVNIDSPVTSTTFSTCQTFGVKATVCNWNEGTVNATDVLATISVTGGNVTWVSGGDPGPGHLMELGTIACNASKPAEWQFHCDGPGDVTFQVYSRGLVDTLTVEDWSKNVTIHQEWKAHLVAYIWTEVEEISKEQWFTWNLKIVNTGQADATGVSGNVHVYEPGGGHYLASFGPWNIPGGGYYSRGFGHECTIPGPVKFKIEPADIIATDENTGQPVHEDNKEGDEKIVGQEIEAELAIHILEPKESTHFECGDEFGVLTMVSNTGEAEAVNVTVTIDISGPAHLVWPTATQDLGTIEPGEHLMDVLWLLECDDVGDVTITVNGTGIDGNCPKDITVHGASTVVHQDPAPHLVVEIITPLTCTNFSVFQDFGLIAKVTNMGCDTAYNTSATIDIAGPASLVPITASATVDLGTILSGGFKYADWDLHCDGSGDVTLTVSPAGEYDGAPIPPKHLVSDSELVHQQEKAHLVVEIEEPEDGDEFVTSTHFNVTGTVTNSGEADALDVIATMSVRPDLSVRPTQGGYTQVLGTIPGGENVTFNWPVHCKVACDSTITVSASGTDKNTQEAIHEDNTEPDSVTVKQIIGPYLEIDISYPTNGDEFTVSENFSVVATVTNTGEATANQVNVTLTDINGNASVVSGPMGGWPQDLAGGASKVASWTVHCDSAGDSVLTAEAEGTNTNTAIDVVTVKQKAAPPCEPVLEIELTATHQIYEGELFTVCLVLSNTGCADAEGILIGVAASNFTDPEIYLDSLSDLAAGDSYVLGYEFLCTGEGGVNIGAEAEGTNTNVAAASVSVQQINVPEGAPALTVDVVAPAHVYVGDPYPVTGVISNIGDATATLVDVELNVFGDVTVAAWPAGWPRDIAAGDSADATWTLLCDGQGGVSATVTAEGTNTNTAVDAAAVQQGLMMWDNLVVIPISGEAPLPITASAEVSNSGNMATTTEAELYVNEEVVASQIVSLGAGAGRIVSFDYVLGAGTYNVTINGLEPIEVVVEPTAPIHLYEGPNAIQYTGSSADFPAVLTNIGPAGLNVARIIWLRDVSTGGAWWFYLVPLDYRSPAEFTGMETDKVYIVVVSAECDWYVLS